MPVLTHGNHCAGIIRTLLFQDAAIPTPYDIQVAELVQKISDLRASLGGGADQGVLSPAFEGGVYVRPSTHSCLLELCDLCF